MSILDMLVAAVAGLTRGLERVSVKPDSWHVLPASEFTPWQRKAALIWEDGQEIHVTVAVVRKVGGTPV